VIHHDARQPKQETGDINQPKNTKKVEPAAFGVCLFHDPMHPSDGLACAGSEKVWPIASLAELDTATVWWTNIPYAVFSRLRLYRRPNLRSDQLLRMHAAALLAELGIGGEPPQVLVRMLYQLVYRITRFLADNYQMSCKGMVRLDWEFRGRMLRRGQPLKGALGGLAHAARDAHSYIHIPTYGTPPGSETRTYMLPRTSHLRSLLALPYPDPSGTWEQVNYRTPRLIEPDRLPSPLTLDTPAFVRINIRKGDPDYFSHTPFVRASGRNTQMRTWATLPEAMNYARHGEVEISKAWVGRYAPLKLLIPPPGEALDFSISAALVAEAMFFALSGLSKPEHSNGLDVIAAWLLACDRLVTQRLASEIYDQGFHPMSHGSMRVVVAGHYADLDEMDRMAISLGLEPPLVVMDEAFDQEVVG